MSKPLASVTGNPARGVPVMSARTTCESPDLVKNAIYHIGDNSLDQSGVCVPFVVIFVHYEVIIVLYWVVKLRYVFHVEYFDVIHGGI